jgi:hypothetical protein
MPRYTITTLSNEGVLELPTERWLAFIRRLVQQVMVSV